MADVDTLADRFGKRSELIDGTPVATETLRRLACDCGVVRHLMRGRSEPLDVGRRTSVCTTAQRRSISLRDGGTCRFVACRRRSCDVHHVRHYDRGGPTAVPNGVLLCPRHHTRRAQRHAHVPPPRRQRARHDRRRTPGGQRAARMRHATPKVRRGPARTAGHLHRAQISGQAISQTDH